MSSPGIFWAGNTMKDIERYGRSAHGGGKLAQLLVDASKRYPGDVLQALAFVAHWEGLEDHARALIAARTETQTTAE